MSADNDLKSVIQSFRNKEEIRDVVVNKVSKSKKSQRANSKKATSKKTSTNSYKDLAPSLGEDLILIFIGFNPGVESSVQQHHYAHFTNLFWKLFNQSKLFLKVLERQGINLEKERQHDPLLKKLTTKDEEGFETFLKPENDFDIVKYKIGFTDLVLRCTRTAEELTMAEKLQNVPRLLNEFKKSKVNFIIFIGKGIWEVVVSYFCKSLGMKNLKLTKVNFLWGKQSPGTDETYNIVLENFFNAVGIDRSLYIFPNTSGLVASMKYQDKLNLWTDLAGELEHSMYKKG